MSNKAYSKLNELDKLIRQTARCGMTDGTVMRIEFISGFEKFNTRPYHNYETWGQGYRVTGLGISVEKEDLDDAVVTWAKLVTDKRAGVKVQPWFEHMSLDTPTLLEDWISAKSVEQAP
jgi:hypothetical protein